MVLAISAYWEEQVWGMRDGMDGGWERVVWAEAALKFSTVPSDSATNPWLALGNQSHDFHVSVCEDTDAVITPEQNLRGWSGLRNQT